MYARAAARLMSMDRAMWMRHANPWSVYTRFTCLPLLVLALYSRVWIGPWAWLATALALLWTWLNPRVFPPPRRVDTWAAKGTFGERVWLNRANLPIPAHHARMAHILAGVAALGVGPLAWGLYALEVWPCLTGLAVVFMGKLWFVDRMVWLYEDMREAYPELEAEILEAAQA